jgi:predicted transcriptional regulator of viral defense system
MRAIDLQRIQKLYFGYEEMARVLGISESSARVSASRYVRQGHLVRIRRNLYVLPERWRNRSREDLFTLANIAMVPSYVSLQTALEYHGLSTQVQRNVVESISPVRTREVEVGDVAFRYHRLRRDRYGGFDRDRGFFVATPEKAFVDALYLQSRSVYRLDEPALDVGRVDFKKARAEARAFGSATARLVEEHERTA